MIDLSDLLARVVAIRGALEDGDPDYAYAIAIEAENELAGLTATLADRRAA
jgi:hypothetical protein